MKKLLVLLCVMGLGVGGFILGPQEAGAVTFNFKDLTPPVDDTPLSSPYGFLASGLTLETRAYSYFSGPDYMYQNSYGLGVQGGSYYHINNSSTGGTGNATSFEWVVFKRPDNTLFNSIKISKVPNFNLGLVRIATGTGYDDFSAPTLMDFTGNTADFTIDFNSSAALAALRDDPYLFVMAPYLLDPTLPAGSGNYAPKTAFRIASLEVTPVPEPATMLLLGSGLIGIGAFVRRKFKK